MKLRIVLFIIFLSYLVMCACILGSGTPSTVTQPINTPRPPSTFPDPPQIPTTAVTTIVIPTTEPVIDTTTATTPNDPDPLEELWEQRKAEYPKATEIWLIMKEFGWSDAACAGIMGNIMRECGGDTLKYIDETLFNKAGTHFGLCQWSAYYYPAIQPTADWMPSIRDQLEFLRYTINFYNGNGYVYGFDEDYLKYATIPEDVAKLFCDTYERPGGTSERREQNAKIAYNYFTSAPIE